MKHHLLELRQTNAKILEEKAAKQLVIQQLEDRLQEKSLAYDYLMQEYHEYVHPDFAFFNLR